MLASVSMQPLSRLALTYRRTRDGRVAALRGFEHSGGLDAKLLLQAEDEFIPALSIGVDAIAGNGIFGSEYLVASKRIGAFDLSLGLGWGRLGEAGPLSNGLALAGGHFDRPERRDEADRGPEVWFTGDRVGWFGSAIYTLPWQLPWLPARAARPALIAEYDSNRSYAERRFDPGFEAGAVPVNLGITSALGYGLRGTFAIEHMERATARLSWTWQSQRKAKPLPGTTVQTQQDTPIATGSSLRSAWLDAATVKPPASLSSAVLATAAAEAKADRKAEQVDLSLASHGLPTMALTMQAADLRRMADGNGSAEEVWAHASSRDQSELPERDFATDFLDLALAPETTLDAFESSTAAIARQSLLLKASYTAERSRIGASLRLNLADNLKRLERDRSSVPFPVRSDIAGFADNRIWLDSLYAAYTEHLLPGLYVGGQAGYLEEQYAGVGSEIIYWPHDAKWALVGNLTQAFRRDSDNPLLLTTDTVVTGELAAYYQFPGGTLGKAAIVSYLGTDAGLRFDLVQPLDNGWELGGYLAFSNADSLSASNPYGFAETGGADFGVRLRVPLGNVLYGLLNIEPVFAIEPLGRDQAQSLRRPVSLYNWIAPAHLGSVVRDWPGLGLQ